MSLSNGDQATLGTIRAAVDTLTVFEGQDRGLIIEMSQHMLQDVIDNGQLAPLADYIRRYCDVLDSSEEASTIAATITPAT